MNSVFLSASLLLSLQARILSGEDVGVPEKYRPAVTRGLDWLAKQQREDGSWTGKTTPYPAALTV